MGLLFHQLRLRRFVVIELKTGPFKPEYAGKMNFYLNLVDDQLRHADDAPSIGLILCREGKRLVAENALRDIDKPMAVAEWRVRLTRELPQELESGLPSIADIERNWEQTAMLETSFELVPLSEVTSPKETCDPKQMPEESFHYVDIASVSNETFSVDAPKIIKGADAPSRARKRIRTDDVIFATTRPYLRGIARVPPQLDQQVCSTGFCVLRASERVIPDWLFYCTVSDAIQNQITPLMRGANYPAITDKDLLRSEIPLPPLDEQRRIVARIKECLERVEEIETLRNEALTDALNLEGSLYSAIEARATAELRTVGEIVERTRNGRSIRQATQDADGFVLTLSAVRSVVLDTSARKPVQLPGSVAESYPVHEGDVFVSRRIFQTERRQIRA